MGYRSEVAFCIKKENYEELIKKAEEYGAPAKDFINYAHIKDQSDTVTLHWDWVKWYPEYEEVGFILDFKNELYDKDEPFTFVRIGEDYDDVEQEYRYGKEIDDICDKIHLERLISVDD